jgi:hypothetical protein
VRPDMEQVNDSRALELEGRESQAEKTRMHWLSRLKRQPSTARATGRSFQRLEWRAYFEELCPERRREACVRLCNALSDRAPIAGEEIEQAMKALLSGETSPELVSATRSVVERVEGEYDEIVGDDEDDCSDPRLNEAFVRARAATALFNVPVLGSKIPRL